MSSVEIRRVANRKDLERFVQFHYDLYRGNAYDAPNLRSDELNTLDKERNAAFEFCEAEYFMAYKEGRLVGRVAAIINRKANEKWQRKSVRFGWIDFEDDIEVSRALLDAVAQWGRQHGMTEVIGPLGFTDMDPEGMLTFGFNQIGTMATIYNYEYYPRHIEQLGGWEKDNDYVEFKVFVPDEIPEKLSRLSEMVAKRYNLRVKTLTKKDVDNGYGRKVFEIINETFADLYGYSQMTDKQIDQYVAQYLPVADLDLIPVIVDGNLDDKPVGVGITIPSLSHALQKCKNGRLLPFGWWHLLKALKWHKTDMVDLMLIGILPEYRKKGANALMFNHLIPYYQKYGFKWGETQVEMETNENVQGQWSFFKTEQHKRRRCYRKSL